MTPAAVLEFWFSADPLPVQMRRWFGADPVFDSACRTVCAPALAQAAAGALHGWTATPTGALALVILLDQIPRNIFRGTARAFATDAQARFIADRAILAGHDQALSAAQRLFLYLPYEHSEALRDQDRAVALLSPLKLADVAEYAQRHRDVIRRYGRFPHRNAALGRTSTAAELAYLATPGAGF